MLEFWGGCRIAVLVCACIQKILVPPTSGQTHAACTTIVGEAGTSISGFHAGVHGWVEGGARIKKFEEFILGGGGTAALLRA